MTAQWVKYDGSDEQIDEMNNAENYITRLDKDRHTEYLICAPHPYADMICQWARTGQPFYVRITEDGDKNEFPELSDFIESVKHVETYCTNTPNWNIPGAEHSFTQFEGVV